MKELEILIEVQDIDNNLGQIEESLKELEADPKLEGIKKEKNIFEKRKLEADAELIKLSEQIKNSSGKLKENYFNIEEINRKLYDGKISDIQQLDYLNEELIELKTATEKLENETLILMEKQEILKSELSKVGGRLEDLAKEISLARESKDKKTDDLSDKIGTYSSQKKKLLSNLDDELLDKYLHIREKRQDFLAIMEGNKCMGCNMILPVYIVDKAKNKDLVHCENCNRILYIE